MEALMRALIVVGLLSVALPASAHDLWANGTAVPDWVKKSCCGPEDVHHLTAQQVHAMADGWHVDLRARVALARWRLLDFLQKIS
jgi:hypothetical protein